MTKQEKIIEKFIKNPESVRLSELIQIIEAQGYTRADAKGSHIRYRKEGSPQIVLALHNNDVKRGYRKRICKSLFPYK